MKAKDIKKKNILVFSDYFLPGYRAGGALKSIFNSISMMKSEISFTVYTRGYDYFPENKYENILMNKIINKNGIRIIYIFFKYIPDTISLVINLIKNNCFRESFDTVYLNSFFSLFSSIIPQILVLLRFIKCKKLIIAPRGELDKGALMQKKIKKFFYIFLYKILRNFFEQDKLIFHTSSFHESNYLNLIFKKAIIKECIDPPSLINPKLSLYKPKKNYLKLIFFSRIDNKKNLKFLIECLSTSTFYFHIQFDVVGPISNKSYWNECLKLSRNLPENIKFNYLGNYSPDQLYDLIPIYDLFVFPTYGENFGHVIFESIRLGTPVITSIYTPWDKNENGILNTFRLDNFDEWLLEIEKFEKTSINNRIENAKNISETISKSTIFSEIKYQYNQLFS